MYSLGARKFAVAGVGAIACVPSILAQSAYSKCSVDVDNLIAPFNRKVKAMISNLNENLPGAKFIYLDVYRMFFPFVLHGIRANLIYDIDHDMLQGLV